MNKHISFLLLANIVNIVTAKSIFENYYWREYNGVIPPDALPAGHDLKDQPIYIGQVLDSDNLIPGKIYENDENVYYEFGEQAWSTNENIKILCTGNSEHFEWVPTTVDDVTKLRIETNVIKGGYQSKFLTFIGRIQLNGRTEVGKVICHQTSCLALYINNNGEEEEYHKFEILTYNPENKNTIQKSYLETNSLE